MNNLSRIALFLLKIYLFTSSSSTNDFNCLCRSFNVPNCSNRSARLSDGTAGLSLEDDLLLRPDVS